MYKISQLKREQVIAVLVLLTTLSTILNATYQSERSGLESQLILRLSKMSVADGAYAANASMINLGIWASIYCRASTSTLSDFDRQLCEASKNTSQLHLKQQLSIESSIFAIQKEVDKAMADYQNKISFYDLAIKATLYSTYIFLFLTLCLTIRKPYRS